MKRPSSRFLAVAAASAAGLVAGVLALAGAGNDTTASAQGTAVPAETTTSATPTTRPTTTTSETTSTTAAAEDPGLAEGGDQGTFDLQVRLAALGYDIDTPDGRYGERTRFAVMAFQKVEGLAADGVAGPRTLAALESASPPGPIVPGGAPTRIEVDLNRQILLYWQGGVLSRVLPVSSGNAQWYCVEGECAVATTPVGTFRIGRKYSGLEKSRLGELYNPMYFHLGWAIHGSPSVPPYPASHGCVRIPMYASASFYSQVERGTLVHVVGQNPPEGPRPPQATSTTIPESTTTTSTAPLPRITVPTVPPTTTTTVPPTTTSTTTEPTTTTTAPPASSTSTTLPDTSS